MAAEVPSTFHGHVELFPPPSAKCNPHPPLPLQHANQSRSVPWTDDSWNYSCRHQENLIIRNCTLTVSFIIWVISRMNECVCVCSMSLFTSRLLYYLDAYSACLGKIASLVIIFGLWQTCFLKDILNYIFWGVWSLLILQWVLKLSWVHNNSVQTTE